MPIGTPTDAYAAAFHGKGNTISNLTISFTAAMGNAGLFDILDSGGIIRDVGMITPNLQSSGSFLGALAGSIASGAEVRSSYVQGGRHHCYRRHLYGRVGWRKFRRHQGRLFYGGCNRRKHRQHRRRRVGRSRCMG